MSYSLWLIPSGKLYSLGKKLIHEVALQYGSPVFEPHITLLGRLEGDDAAIRQKTGAFAAKIKPFSLRVSGISFQDDFFKALFALIENTPELIALNREAVRMFLLPDMLPYMPHMSLMYGKQREEIKRNIIKNVDNQLNISSKIKQIALVKGMPGETYENIKKWQILETYFLTG